MRLSKYDVGQYTWFNDISTSYGLFNTEIRFIHKCLIMIITIYLIGSQVFLSNINNLYMIILFQVTILI